MTVTIRVQPGISLTAADQEAFVLDSSSRPGEVASERGCLVMAGGRIVGEVAGIAGKAPLSVQAVS